mgnify:CR=1 FL=1
MKKNKHKENNSEVVRVPTPKENQVIGKVITRHGCSKSTVKCSDGKVRMCRVPGAKRRYLKIRPGLYVIVSPWKIQGDEKGDIILQYRGNQVKWLKSKGYLKGLSEEEF